ncbi:DNA-binding protein [Escherichia coli]|nr:DNA-binding protein [Escherichia coli]
MTATKNVKLQKNDYPASVDHSAAMIEELRADPDYANAYLANALEEINEPGGLGGFLVALRQVIEALGGISEAARKSGLARQSIYRALSPNGNPTITTLAQLTSVAGLQFTLSEKPPRTLAQCGRGGKAEKPEGL